MQLFLYPDRESNAELSLRRTLLYPFNYQGSVYFWVQRYEFYGNQPKVCIKFFNLCSKLIEQDQRKAAFYSFFCYLCKQIF